jgi:ER-bound oxygenase mpaB/B'/Rubber oxygenase, catalytic domain
MSRVVLPEAALDELRTLGDPCLETKARENRTIQSVYDDREDLPGMVTPDRDKLVLAQRLFGDYTPEIAGALLLAALPQSYATEYGAAVLGARGELENDLTRRIGRTAKFLLTIMQRGADTDADQGRLWDWNQWRRKGPALALPWGACVHLRIIHQGVRDELDEERHSRAAKNDDRIDKLLGDRNCPPLNKEDLLGMQLMFCVVVFEVLDLYGIAWSADEQEAYLHLWDLVGGYLAIGSDQATIDLKEKFKVPSDWLGLRPPTIDQSRDLLQQIRKRQWVDPTPQANVSAWEWSALRSGRVLARALLDELEAGMPPLLKPLPIAIMRALNTDVVRRRLNLGGNGVLLQSLTLLPKREVKVAPFTSVRSPNKVAGRVLRTMANDVTSRARVHLGQQVDLTIPGSPDWQYTP